MIIYSIFRKTVNSFTQEKQFISKRINRIAMNALIIGNCCLVTSLFFVANKAILAIALPISIIGSSILIDRCYK